MTEYESAQLVFMHAERLANMISLIQGNTSLIQTDISICLTLLSGYLLIAHLAGAKLTRIQVSILNVLYFAAAGVGVVMVVRGIVTQQNLVNRFLEISGEAQVPVVTAEGAIVAIVAIFVRRQLGWPVGVN